MHMSMRRPAEPTSVRAEAAGRLRSLRVQLVEITCLLQSDVPCPQVLSRMLAAQDTLRLTQHLLLLHHLTSCLQRIEQVSDEAACRQALDQILELYGVSRAQPLAAPMAK